MAAHALKPGLLVPKLCSQTIATGAESRWNQVLVVMSGSTRSYLMMWPPPAASPYARETEKRLLVTILTKQ